MSIINIDRFIDKSTIMQENWAKVPPGTASEPKYFQISLNITLCILNSNRSFQYRSQTKKKNYVERQMQESIEHKLELRLRLKSSQISNIDRALAMHGSVDHHPESEDAWSRLFSKV